MTDALRADARSDVHRTHVRVERLSAHRSDLVLDRAAKLNALTEAMLEDLLAAAEDLRRERPRVVVLRSSSDRAFCVGADLTEQSELTPVRAYALSELGNRAFDAIATLPCPVIGRVTGHCMGGGFELALACDLRVGTPDLRLSFPETGLGNSPAWGGMGRITNLVGRSRALDLLWTGRAIDGATAMTWGLLDRVAEGPGRALDDEVDTLAATIAARAPLAQTAAKRRIDASYRQAQTYLEAPHAAFQSTTNDAAAGKRSFAAGEHAITFEGR